MRYKEELGFCIIYRDRPVTTGIRDCLKTAFRKNTRLFEREPERFNVIICDTNSMYRKHAKYYYTPKGTATVLRNNDMVIKSPELIERVGRFKAKDFCAIVAHEMNHVFWTDFYDTTRPCWLLEGLALQMDGKRFMTKKQLKDMIKKEGIDYSFLDYRYLDRNLHKTNYPRYDLWANFTRYIARRHRLKSLVRLMDLFSRDKVRENYDRSFKRIFGKTEKQMFLDFQKSLR